MSNAKRVLITGASAGFGYGTSKALAEKGHTVFATMRGVSGKNEEKATEHREWAKTNGHALIVLELDVTDEASVDNAVATATADRPIDVLVNNAGIGNFGIDENFSVDRSHVGARRRS